MLTVLLVEDHELLVGMYREIIESAGHSVTACASAEEALISIARTGPDVVVADQTLSGVMTGLDLLNTVAKQQVRVGLVLISGDSEPTSPLPANCIFLPKPFLGTTMLEAISAATARR